MPFRASEGTIPEVHRLNGPQNTGRDYRNLSRPAHVVLRDEDVEVPVRDGSRLRADVYRPEAEGRYPVLVAASPYPREIQDVGAPMGFIEAGNSEFFVSRGYVHVIANVRGTGGSEGTYAMWDAQERQDAHDLVEWAAAQPWSDGNVGMVGISYFASSQVGAAVEQPPHLKAIFPLALTPDFYEATYHHGLFSASFMTPFITMIGVASRHGKKLWRGRLMNLARKVLAHPRIHARFATMNGEAAVTGLRLAMRAKHDPEPWDSLWRSVAVEHQVRDGFWDERSVLEALPEVDIPVYLGCDWENVPLHLPGTFSALGALPQSENVRVAMLGKYGLTWPWESLHEECLAWFDHWLKGADTGILEGPRIRYWLPVAEEWKAAEAWPPPEAELAELALAGDGVLGGDLKGSRSWQVLGSGLNRPDRAARSDPPSEQRWITAALRSDVDLAGDFELLLDASSTATDTAWIATVLDIGPDGEAEAITAGWLRASMREVDEEASRPGAPVLPCRNPSPVPIGEVVRYRLPIVPSARRLRAGHRLGLVLTSDDTASGAVPIMGFSHAPVGTNATNTVFSTSRLLVSVIAGEL